MSSHLSEGVDVPTLDGVAFIDPRSSEIDIIQSVGRAIRLNENKTMGTIVIPVFIEQTDNAHEALEASDFKPIWDVLEALKSHDERLSDELDQLRIELGAKRKRSVETSDLTKIVFDLPASVNENFAQSLRVHLVERTTESWMFWLGLLEEYTKEYGNCSVPLKYASSDGFNLGFWVSNQRTKQKTLSKERRSRLDALGFVWDALKAQWEEGFEHLRSFVKDNGHCRIPGKHKSSDGYALGSWVNSQRTGIKSISAERKSRLEGIGFLWDGFTIVWEGGFEHLQSFVRDNGHCRVPSGYKSPDGYRVGQWVATQRTKQKKLSAERKARLDALGFVWDARELRWEDGFERLSEYKVKSGDCRVPASYKSSDDYPLGQWVTVQRTKQETLSNERKARLDALGFVWDARDSQWEEGFEHLKEFKATHGHCRVSQSYRSLDGFRLGAWLHRQRQMESILPQQKAKLEMLGVVWDPFALKWEEAFAKTHEFAKENGHCNIVAAYKTADGYGLGMWVRKQRAAKDKMAPVRQQRLEALPGWVWKIEK